jgi:diguanylate cyclase (GGDEF)-like protein/PAS domain S-box-containing protein
MPEKKDTGSTGDPLSRLSSEQQLSLMRTLVDSAVDAIVAHEAGGGLVFYSRSTCELLGRTCEQMSELEPYGWVAPESMAGTAERLERIFANGKLVFESSVIRGDGSVIPTEVTSRLVVTEVGPLVISVIRDLTERNDALEQLEYLAYHDALTGLANRIAFGQRLDTAIANSRRFGDLLILAYLDLDRFKPINDRFGHEAGDDMLIEIGRRLVECVRVQDVVARLGGDEFVILLERVESVNEIPGIAQRLLDSVREPIPACGTECALDASIGFAVFDPEADDARSLVVKSDAAMYQAKRDPERRWHIYDPSEGGEADLRVGG